MQTPTIAIFDAADYDAQIRAAADLLRQGKLVVVPTETVYGAIGLLKEPAAVKRLRDLRSDASLKPLTLHLAYPDQAAAYLGPVGELGNRMIKKLWPGPVALVFDVGPDRRRQVAAEIGVAEVEIYDGQMIILRCPDHAVATDLIAAAASPVVGVRAGIGFSQPVLRADQAARALDGKVDLVLDGGPSRYSKPSTIIRVRGEKYEIVRSGVYDERIIERLLRTTILFVCSGNTCRSPMAEAIARRLLSDRLKVPEAELEKKGLSVISAGSSAIAGAKATPQAVEAVRGLGADLSRHRSRPLSVELIHQADVVFTMGRAHASAVTALVPSAAAKVATLAPGRDIEDPIGGDEALYVELAGELRQLIETRLRERPLP
jgi:protein-tyrosine phosphatase